MAEPEEYSVTGFMLVFVVLAVFNYGAWCCSHAEFVRFMAALAIVWAVYSLGRHIRRRGRWML